MNSIQLNEKQRIASTPAILKAKEFTLNFIKDFSPGQKLPPISDLSKRANVALVTMFKAIKLLEKDKKVTVRWGQGIFNGDGAPQPIKREWQKNRQYVKKSLMKWEKIKNLILREIVEGKFHESEYLPSQKELCSQYSVHTKTIKKALETLTLENRISLSGTRFRIQRSRLRWPSGRILYIVHEKAFHPEWSWQRSQFESSRRYMENMCNQQNIHISIFKYSPETARQLALIHNIDGIIVWVDENIETILLSDLLPHLKNISLPVIYMHYCSNLSPELSMQLLRRKDTYILTTSRRNAQSVVARYLIDLGHRNIAYISYNKNDTLEGLKSTFESAGILSSCCITHYSISDDSKFLQPIEQRENRLIFKDRSRSEALNNILHNGISQVTDPFDKASLENRLTELTLCASYEYTLRHILGDIVSQNCLSSKPQVDTKQKPPISTIVTFDAYSAVFGVRPFLKRNNILVPKDISVIACDDIEDSFYAQQTCFCFNWSGATHNALNLILYQSSRKEHSKDRIIEVDGYIMERGSIGRIAGEIP